MKKIIVFDTETNGLPKRWTAPIEDTDNWPRLVQLSYILYHSDGEQIQERDYIIRPDGFTIDPESSKIHGISHRRALEEGCELGAAIDDFDDALGSADVVVAHNLRFDKSILACEVVRLGGDSDELDYPNESICTMLAGVSITAIPGARGGYKWPKLEELYHKLFGSSFENAHNSLADAQATARCFFAMVELGDIELDL